MKVSLSVLGKFHHFDLAAQLQLHGHLQKIFTGYPAFKLKDENIPRAKIITYPWLHAPYMAFTKRERLGRTLLRAWEEVDRATFENFVEQQLDAPDVFVGLSGSALKGGRKAIATGGVYICDRGSSHILHQDNILSEEHKIWEMEYHPIPDVVKRRETCEYSASTAITVPSSFAKSTFVENGVPAAKIHVLPYGVNLQRFSVEANRSPERIDIIFVGGASLRKGVPYLLKAYKALQTKAKSLTFVGSYSPSFVRELTKRGLVTSDIKWIGHVPSENLKNIMARSHVLVLPSIEEGLALVQAQAMASGCVVIGTANGGAEDLFTDGHEGFIVPIRDAEAIRLRLEQLLSSPSLLSSMSSASLARVNTLGGWNTYGINAIALYKTLLSTREVAGDGSFVEQQ